MALIYVFQGNFDERKPNIVLTYIAGGNFQERKIDVISMYATFQKLAQSLHAYFDVFYKLKKLRLF